MQPSCVNYRCFCSTYPPRGAVLQQNEFELISIVNHMTVMFMINLNRSFTTYLGDHLPVLTNNLPPIRLCSSFETPSFSSSDGITHAMVNWCIIGMAMEESITKVSSLKKLLNGQSWQGSLVVDDELVVYGQKTNKACHV